MLTFPFILINQSSPKVLKQTVSVRKNGGLSACVPEEDAGIPINMALPDEGDCPGQGFPGVNRIAEKGFILCGELNSLSCGVIYLTITWGHNSVIEDDVFFCRGIGQLEQFCDITKNSGNAFFLLDCVPSVAVPYDTDRISKCAKSKEKTCMCLAAA